MVKRYEVLETENGLINIKDLGTSSRTVRIKESLVDSAQKAYLALRKEKGINYPITTRLLCEKMNCPVPTFNQNICGGIAGLLSLSERVVAERFAEAVESVNGSFHDRLAAGLRSLFPAYSWSGFNGYRQTQLNMNLRTTFCVRAFSARYWECLLQPLRPSMDTYLAEKGSFVGTVPPEAKDFLYSMFAHSFQWIIALMVQEDLSRYKAVNERNERLLDYVRLCEKALLSGVRDVMECRYYSGSDFIKIVNRLSTSENRKD